MSYKGVFVETGPQSDCLNCRVGAWSQTRPPISIHRLWHPQCGSQFEPAGLRPNIYPHILDEVCRGLHRPASAEAMQEGYHCSNPHLQMGDLRQPDILLSPLQWRLPGRKGGASRASLATRLKSGVMIMRAIYITGLKRGESEKPTLQNMRTIVRSETTPYMAIAGMCEPQPLRNET